MAVDKPAPNLSGLLALGFKAPEKIAPKRRVVWSWEGPTKSGKTYWPLRHCPGPILYQDIDLGSEDSADRVIEERGDVVLGSTASGRYEFAKDIQKSKDQVKLAAKPIWDVFVKDYYRALESSLKPGGIRTIIWDTATDFWDLCLNMTQGKEVKLMPEERTTANNLFKGMVKAAFMYKANLILIHHMMPEFDNPKVLERKGFNRIHTVVESAIQTTKKRKKGEGVLYEAKINICRSKPLLEGETYDIGSIDEDGDVSKGYDFAMLAAEVTGTSPKDWR